ncbi:phosphotransferase [Plantactinospora sp. KBS50]|uniref:phosphotransferase n=1 Tax=Plantactinospora sp. KBS50 TaxID=2024580 RepID=UPI000BAAE41C|nr:phosphotransferase [Plantactinospora sp. KBS50]ASW54414.1 serine/threonine protein kinase [Plantactinospora sp. KBS50]
MGDPELLASGRDADVFAVDEHRVLRRYRHGGDATAEAEVLAYLADRGVPVPRVYAADGPDLVLERIGGPTLLRALLAGECTPGAAAGILVELQSALHAVPPLRGADPADRILHLDLHPDNVMLDPRGPVLIDWRNATEGPPEFDVAVTALILAEVAVDDTASLVPGGGATVAALAGEVLAAFLSGSARRPESQLDRAAQLRRRNETLSAAERGRIGAAAALVRRRAETVRLAG